MGWNMRRREKNTSSPVSIEVALRVKWPQMNADAVFFDFGWKGPHPPRDICSRPNYADLAFRVYLVADGPGAACQLLHHLVDAKAGRFLPRRKFFKALQPLRNKRLSGHKQEAFWSNQ